MRNQDTPPARTIEPLPLLRESTSPKRLRPGLLFLSLLWTVVLGAPNEAVAQTVELQLSATGNLVLEKFPEVLDNVAIAQKLTSGLTTTFYFRVTTGRRDNNLGGADVSVRYDIWEEVFLLTIRDGLGTTHTETQPQDQLEERWSQLQVALASRKELPNNSNTTQQPLELLVTLTVLPFSSGELADTKRWLSRTGATGRRRAPEPGNTAQASSQLFDLLLGTSLERKALLTKKWIVGVQPSSEEASQP